MINLSIIIPVYNAEQTIENCINSILNQTYRDYEIICINDGSTDKSLSILKDMQQKNDNIVIYNQENSGVSIARNNGVKYSRGTYVMFIDNDDYLDSKDCLDKYMSKVLNDDLDILIGSYIRKDQNKKIIFKQRINVNSSWSKYLEVTPWARVFRRKFLVDNKISFKSMKIGEDIYFNFKCYSLTNKIGYIKNYDYVWFYNTASVSNTKQRGLNDEIDILDFYRDLLNVVDLTDSQIIYFIYRYSVWYLLFSGRTATKGDFITEYVRIYSWLKANNFNKTISPLSLKLKGEGFRNRFAVLIFKIMNYLHLQKIFATIYCRGSE